MADFVTDCVTDCVTDFCISSRWGIRLVGHMLKTNRPRITPALPPSFTHCKDPVNPGLRVDSEGCYMLNRLPRMPQRNDLSVQQVFLPTEDPLSFVGTVSGWVYITWGAGN